MSSYAPGPGVNFLFDMLPNSFFPLIEYFKSVKVLEGLYVPGPGNSFCTFDLSCLSFNPIMYLGASPIFGAKLYSPGPGRV